MSVTCPIDGTRHPDGADFCMHCGRPLGAGGAGRERPVATGTGSTWEHTDLSVPIRLKVPLLEPAAVVGRVETAVRLAVERAGDEGWEPEHALDFESLERLGRIERTERRGFLGLGSPVTTYVAALIHLRRIAIE
jgi:hypothetical protein